MAATVLLVLLIVVASFMTTVEINRLEKDTSCERLAEEAADIAQNVETLIANDREQLEMVATVFARFDDLSPKDFQDILDAYEAVGTLSRLELLLPGDVLLTRGGRQVNASGYLSFQEAAARGAHISDRLEDFVTGSGYVVHHYVPIVRDGETIAVLCGVVELNRLPEVLDFTPYGGQAALYVIDGATGNFLLDTWHGGNGNIWELGERPMADGYDADAMRQGLIDGASNYVVFVSETTGSYLYFYYMPLHINEWRLALSVPEAAVFANANHVRTILNTLLAFEVLAFILYFLWTLRYVQRETGEKQRQRSPSTPSIRWSGCSSTPTSARRISSARWRRWGRCFPPSASSSGCSSRRSAAAPSPGRLPPGCCRPGRRRSSCWWPGGWPSASRRAKSS